MLFRHAHLYHISNGFSLSVISFATISQQSFHLYSIKLNNLHIYCLLQSSYYTLTSSSSILLLKSPSNLSVSKFSSLTSFLDISLTLPQFCNSGYVMYFPFIKVMAPISAVMKTSKLLSVFLLT